MNAAKLRAAILVFLVGFTLGLSVFAASRLFVRSVLDGDALATAVALAERVQRQETITPTGTLSSVVRYTRFDAAGEPAETVDVAGGAEPLAPATNPLRMRLAADSARAGRAVVDHNALLPSLLGLTEPANRGVAVPLDPAAPQTGSLFVEIDQEQALQALKRAFSAASVVVIAFSALAIIALAFVARGRGAAATRRRLDAENLPRDPLTELPTRSSFAAALDDAVARATAADTQIGLMIIHIAGFRSVNDVWGHGAGDAILRAAADRLRKFARGPASLARITGTNFALIVEEEANSHSLRRLGDEIRDVLTAPYAVGSSNVRLGARIGAAIFPVNADSAEMLFRAADSALSRARTEGRSAMAFFDTAMEREMQRRAVLERDLRQALDRKEFVVFYQPQIELATGRLRGHEALVRWERPDEGILAPEAFLSVAEDTGLIGPLGEWVLRRACQDAASWLHEGTVSVNFSAVQFRLPGLDETIAGILAETGLPPERLEVEVPERLFLAPPADVMETLHRIKALGVRIAMDDFGVGCSGLASLARFPFDKVKIDKSFVSQLPDDQEAAAVIASIVGLGRSLSVDITAEGVETDEQVALLRASGCSLVQGFLFGMPQRKGPAAADEDAEAAGDSAAIA